MKTRSPNQHHPVRGIIAAALFASFVVGCAAEPDSVEATAADELSALAALGLDEDSPEARGIVAVANTVSVEILDVDIGMWLSSAQRIVANRPYATVAELDAVYRVGPRTIEKILVYAEANGYVDRGGDDPLAGQPEVHGIKELSYESIGILAVANGASVTELDIDAAMRKDAARNIFYGRPYATLTEVDAVRRVGAAAFRQLLAYAYAQGLVPSCGDGVTYEILEQCDDANADDGDWCDSACKLTAICGDGLVENQEQCEDGNTDDGDGCSARCEWEIRWASGGNTTPQTADAIGTHTFIAGTFSARRGGQYWKITLDAPSRVRVDIMARSNTTPINDEEFRAGVVGGAPGQADRWMFNEVGVSDPQGGSWDFWRWYWDPNCSSSGCRRPDYSSVRKYSRMHWNEDAEGYDMVLDLPPGEYYFSLLTGAGNSNYRPPLSYLAEISVETTGAVCGNDIVDGNEACDDGNMTDGDGCNRRCELETMAESEPNNSQGTADAMGGYQRITGVNTAGDQDWFGFRVGADGAMNASLAGCPFDADFELYDADGTLVASDDDSAGNYCPLLDLDNLDEGPHFLRVTHYSASAVGGPYTLQVQH